MSNAARPSIDKLRDIITFIEQSERALHDARVWLVSELERREREPVQRSGFLQVKDHSDGLTPHNTTRSAVGLRKRDQSLATTSQFSPAGEEQSQHPSQRVALLSQRR